MFRKYILPVIAILGALFGFFMVYLGLRKLPAPEIPFKPPTPPYQYNIAGAGIIEAASEEINIGVPFNEMVTNVYVQAGDFVSKNTPLFQLDTQALDAELRAAEKSIEIAKSRMNDAKVRLELFEKLKDKSAVSQDAINRQIYAVIISENQWKEAEARRDIILTNIKRSTVKAPFDGQVLQVNVRVSQDATRNPFDMKPHMLFGKVHPLHVRVDVDENDAWRVEAGAPATAFVRGNSALKFPLRFKRIEPYILPKESLTGDTQERVDTRVLQIIYEFDKEDLPVYVGQILDVYIQAKEND